jgi:transcriptional regulator with XRE-family HTH domain
MVRDGNVKNHIAQGETSHFPQGNPAPTPYGMDENEVFRLNLLRIMAEKGFDAANLSRAAKLNARAVKDIEERRAVSPKLSTIFKLAKALSVEPAELMGLTERQKLEPELVAYLAQYSEEDQKKLLLALASLTSPKP